MHTTGTNTTTGAYAPAYVVTPQGANHHAACFTGVNTPTGAYAPAYVVTPQGANSITQ